MIQRKSSSPLMWRVCCGSVLVLSLLVFTPFVIPPGEYEPLLLGLPYTLWVTIVIGFLLWGCTLVGLRVHPACDSEED